MEDTFFSNESSNNTSRNPVAPLSALVMPISEAGVSDMKYSNLMIFFIITNGFWCLFDSTATSATDLAKLLGLSSLDIDANRLSIEKSAAMAKIGSILLTTFPAETEIVKDDDAGSGGEDEI